MKQEMSERIDLVGKNLQYIYSGASHDKHCNFHFTKPCNCGVWGKYMTEQLVHDMNFMRDTIFNRDEKATFWKRKMFQEGKKHDHSRRT